MLGTTRVWDVNGAILALSIGGLVDRRSAVHPTRGRDSSSPSSSPLTAYGRKAKDAWHRNALTRMVLLLFAVVVLSV